MSPAIAHSAPRTGPGLRSWRYLGVFFAPIGLAALIGLAFFSFLVRALETTGPVSAARRQQETGELYGAALVYRPFAYKLERYRILQPDILIVGSSRVMQFAGEAFNTSVLNSGGAANSMSQAVNFTRAAISIHKPKAILIGLDFWWFNPNREGEIDTSSQDSDAVELSLSQLAMPLSWLWDGQLTPEDFLASLWPAAKMPSGIGVLAKFARQGWDIYGRYDYGGLLDGAIGSDDRKFKRTLKRVRSAKPAAKLSVRVAPSANAIEELRRLLAELEEQSIEATLLLPPIAAPVLVALTDEPEERLLPIWHDVILSLGARVFDFEDASRISSGECEFIDGFHGGEVTYLRILEAIAGLGDSTLARSIDRDMVVNLIAANAGHARAAELSPATAPAEIDFLGLGCDKEKR